MIRKPMLITDLVVDRGAVLSASSVNLGGSGKGDSILPAPTQSVTGRPNVPLEALDASVSLSIDGSSSSATIRLAEGTNVDGRAYVEMYTAQGSAGVFRTRSPRVGYGATSTTLQLEHAVNEIGDFIIDAKIQDEYTLEGAMRKIFSYYTPKSGLWRLGQVQLPMTGNGFEVFDRSGMNLITTPGDSSVTTAVVADKDCILDIDHDNCLDAIRGVLEQYPCMMMSFDFSSRPWTLNIVNRQGIVSAEGRLSRNVKSAVVTRDDSELCTKAWIEGYKKKGEYGAYENKTASAKYGLIERVISGANDTPKAAKQTAKTYVQNHHEPRITVTIDGIDLSRITGETMDKFTIGKLMRLALPDYGETVTETITGITYSSIYKNPDAVSITLNQEEDKVIRYIKKAQESARRAGRSAARVASTAILDMSVKDNVLTLTKGDGTSVNFSKATALDGSWSGGVYTAKAAQKNRNTGNGALVTTTVATRTTTLNGIVLQAGKTPSVSGVWDINIPLRVTYYLNNATLDTGYKKTITVSAESVYNKGWAIAYGKVDLPKKEKTNSNQIEIKTPSASIGGTTKTYYHLENANDNIVDLRTLVNSQYVTVARLAHYKYNHGWNNAAGQVSLPRSLDPGETNSVVTFKYPGTPGEQVTHSMQLYSTTPGSTGYAVLSYGASAVYGRISLSNWYDAGKAAASVAGAWENGTYTAYNTSNRQGHYVTTSIRKNVPDAKRTIDGDTVTATIQVYNGTSETPEDVVNVKINVPQTSYVSKTLRCTEVTPTYPGSSSNYYYFRLEGRYSFSANTNYTMYRTSW